MTVKRDTYVHFTVGTETRAGIVLDTFLFDGWGPQVAKISQVTEGRDAGVIFYRHFNELQLCPQSAAVREYRLTCDACGQDLPKPPKPTIKRGDRVEFRHREISVVGVVFARYGKYESTRLNVTIVTGPNAGESAYPHVDSVKLVRGYFRVLSREEAE